MNDAWNMGLAIEQAQRAYRLDEVPVGALVVDEYDKILARAHNLKEKNRNPCHHAEILALSGASEAIGGWRLENCTLYTTLEPCTMCMGAIVNGRVAKVVFGAYDEKGGSLSLGFGIHNSARLNHRVGVVGGFMHYECSRLLSEFFRHKRRFYP